MQIANDLPFMLDVRICKWSRIQTRVFTKKCDAYENLCVFLWFWWNWSKITIPKSNWSRHSMGFFMWAPSKMLIIILDVVGRFFFTCSFITKRSNIPIRCERARSFCHFDDGESLQQKNVSAVTEHIRNVNANESSMKMAFFLWTMPVLLLSVVLLIWLHNIFLLCV